TRFAIGRTAARVGVGDQVRFIAADEQLEQNHAAFRRANGLTSRSASRGPDTMQEVVFSACRPEELAWESNGQGDFTRNAVALLRAGASFTNAELQHTLVERFTPSGRQHPMLDSAAGMRALPLFSAGTGSVVEKPASEAAWPTSPIEAPPVPPGIGPWLRDLADHIERRS
ncbi:MAG TPA: hypothetical protein VFN10_15920, partial [Thermoanaerobaculia bacterium]|nr:hypothetical protein [Thermoanaerobaculia bacterium]